MEKINKLEKIIHNKELREIIFTYKNKIRKAQNISLILHDINIRTIIFFHKREKLKEYFYNRLNKIRRPIISRESKLCNLCQIINPECNNKYRVTCNCLLENTKSWRETAVVLGLYYLI